MLKRYWFLTVFIFFLGITLGVFGHMYWGTILQLQPGVNQPAEKDNATKVDAMKADIPKYSLPDPGIKGHDAGIGSMIKNETNASDAEEKKIALSENEKDKIISDYKQALGILFDAWKAKDIPEFQASIARAYTGEILESHMKKAEKFLPQGIGLDVTEVTFDHVEILSADANSATVNAIYRYTVRDYDLDEEFPVGEEFKHFVHVRANLVKISNQWFITGETVI